MTNRCKTCRHWGADSAAGVFIGPEMKECRQLARSRAIDTEAVDSDGEYVGVVLATAPDFGCVLHELRGLVVEILPEWQGYGPE